MSNQGVLVVVSGFSGASKGTLMKVLLEKYHNYALSISATTRKPRVGEVGGKEYLFIIGERFGEMIVEEGLIEYARYVDDHYGTSRQHVFQQMADGKDVILEIEIQEALKVKEKFPEAPLLFVLPPSMDVLKGRLIERGTESMEMIQVRFHRASEEAAGTSSYDYIFVNDRVGVCAKEMHRLIQVQHNRVSSNSDFTEQMRQGLKKYQ